MSAWIHHRVWRADYCMFWLTKHMLTVIIYPFILIGCMWRQRSANIGAIPLYHAEVMRTLVSMAVAEWSVRDYWQLFNDRASQKFCAVFWSAVLICGALSYAILYHLLFGA